MSSQLRFSLLLAPLVLAGCGFTPLYGGSGSTSVASNLDTVNVQNIPERAGQMLRIALEQKFHAAGQPAVELYGLRVSYGIGVAGIGLQEDTSSTRSRFTATASWTLTPIGAPQKILATGLATTEDAINVIDQQYFAYTLETDTVNQQLANEISDQITAQVGTYFKSHPG